MNASKESRKVGGVHGARRVGGGSALVLQEWRPVLTADETDAIKLNLIGQQPQYIRGYLDALKATGRVSDEQVEMLLSWATEAAIRRMVTGPLGNPGNLMSD